MGLWDKYGNSNSVPRFMLDPADFPVANTAREYGGLPSDVDASTMQAIDITAASNTNIRSMGIKTPGWVRYEEYGNGRRRVETLVAMRTMVIDVGVGGVWKNDPLRNLLYYTEQLDNPIWTTTTSSVVADTDGAADKLIPAPSAVFASISQNVASPIGRYSLSAEVKPAGFDLARLQFSSAGKSGYCAANFNLTSVTVAPGNKSPYSSSSGTITPLPDGFYKITLTGTAVTDDVASITVGCFVSGNGVDGIEVRKVQFESGLVTEYQPIYAHK